MYNINYIKENRTPQSSFRY